MSTVLPLPAARCRHEERPPLSIPVVALDGGRDYTVPRGYMAQWQRYTTGPFRLITLPAGDHYFVSKLYQEVSPAAHFSCASGRPMVALQHACGRDYRQRS